jgi:hypothetical protein
LKKIRGLAIFMFSLLANGAYFFDGWRAYKNALPIPRNGKM